jgi:hypothetical protein
MQIGHRAQIVNRAYIVGIDGHYLGLRAYISSALSK